LSLTTENDKKTLKNHLSRMKLLAFLFSYVKKKYENEGNLKIEKKSEIYIFKGSGLL